MRRVMFALVFALSLLAISSQRAHAQPGHRPVRNVWFTCRIHLDWATMTHVTARQCWTIPMPREHQRATGWTITRTRLSPHVERSVRFPVLSHPMPKSAAVPSTNELGGGYTVPMLVTYYLATGSPMANGLYPSVGWAACGYDLALGQRVYVPGVGSLTCGDRIGFDPYRHIDVFGIALGSGVRNVTVYR